jgi:hypothetical protein
MRYICFTCRTSLELKRNGKKRHNIVEMTSWNKWRHTAERVIKGSPEKWDDDKIDNANQSSDTEICGDSSE